MDAPSDAATDPAPSKPANAFRVCLLRAKGLPIMDRNMLSKGGSSDPFVTLTLGDEKRTSSVKKKNLAPVWLETFDLPIDDAAATLEVVVEDSDLLSGNDFMGSVSIPLDAAARTLDRRWYFRRADLPKTGRGDAGRDVDIPWRQNARLRYPLSTKDAAGAGKIELTLLAVHDPALELPTPDAFLADDAFPDKEANALDIYLVRARGLPVMDAGILSKGSSDPVVTLSVRRPRDLSTGRGAAATRDRYSRRWPGSLRLRAARRRI